MYKNFYIMKELCKMKRILLTGLIVLIFSSAMLGADIYIKQKSHSDAFCYDGARNSG